MAEKKRPKKEEELKESLVPKERIQEAKQPRGSEYVQPSKRPQPETTLVGADSPDDIDI